MVRFGVCWIALCTLLCGCAVKTVGQGASAPDACAPDAACCAGEASGCGAGQAMACCEQGAKAGKSCCAEKVQNKAQGGACCPHKP